MLLLVYCFVASVLPVQYLLQPRDYLSSYVLFVTIGLGLVGVLVVGPSHAGRTRSTAFRPRTGRSPDRSGR